MQSSKMNDRNVKQVLLGSRYKQEGEMKGWGVTMVEIVYTYV
jgi:hypothetical protein